MRDSFVVRRFRSDAFLLDIAVFALCLSTSSRLLVTFLGAPAAVNFLHFPVVAALFLLSLRRIRRPAVLLHACIATLLLIYAASAALNAAGVVNAVAGFLILAEPFLLFAVLVNSRAPASSVRVFGWWLLFFALVQIPIAFAQLPRAHAVGNLDLVQGTFTGMVVGHHILGGVAMVGAVYLFRWPANVAAWVRWPLVILLFGVVVISDTKQVVLAFLVGYTALRVLRLRSTAQALRLVARLAALVAVVYVSQRLVQTHAYFHQATAVISAFLGKFVVFSILVDHFESFGNWIIGVGPGHGVSRLGGWLLEKYWQVLEPLGATRTDIAAEVWSVSGYFGERSSLFIPLFSWAAIFGEIGIAGLVTYAALLGIAWRFCVDDTVRVIVLSIVCLGFLFEWLEEPNFMLYALAVVAQKWLAVTGDPTAPRANVRRQTESPSIVCLLPTAGVHWQPALVEWQHRQPNLKVLTARESLARMLAGNIDVEVDGDARIFGDDPNAAGYRGKLTWVSPKVGLRLWRLRPSLVFSNSFGIWTAVAVLLAPLRGWRTVIFYEGSAPGVDFRSSPARTTYRRLLVRGADAFVSNTASGRRYLVEVLGAPAASVYTRPYLVPSRANLNLDTPKEAGHLSGLERPLFLYVGALTARKGVRELLRACGALQGSGADHYSLVIVGDGPLRRELVGLADELGLNGRVHWMGRVPYSDVGAYLRVADVVVLPTWEDTWGMTVPEALLAGKPVLCSVRAGSSELVEDGENGFLVDPEDPRTLVEGMRRFVEHPDIASAMGKRGQQVMTRHSPAAAGEFLAELAGALLPR